MKTVHVNTGRPYDIFIERGIIDLCGEYVKKLSKAEKVVVVTDTNVAPHYKWRVLNSLEQQDLRVQSFIYPAGEIVALGGGVCGDMAGFAAATYLRGIDFIQIPTSLLAQVDSSVGGKTGVDLPQGKNLVGAFHQPIAVLIDPDTLNTLPDNFVSDGMAEVIKYGCIKDAAFFDLLESEDVQPKIEEVIETCVSIKRDVVSRDEREAGERMLLNFGHTLGHSIEKIYNFTGITHGMAVAIGMILIARAGELHGVTKAGTADRIVKICEKYHLPTSDAAGFAQMAQEAQGDKKTSGSKINLVLLRTIGESFILSLPLEDLEDFITT